MESRRPVLLVGNAGTGKSVLLADKLRTLDQDLFQIQSVPFNFYTTSAMLQAIFEKPLEKKAGRNYGPPGTKRLIYFIDDTNMPEVDKYGTVAPRTLIRQHMDRGHWYDRTKLTQKDIHNCQYVACMNPTAGSFTIDPRLQRHFCLFSLSFPGTEALVTIYRTILSQHAAGVGFGTAVQNACTQLVHATIALHQRVALIFLPIAVKFHYIFNSRDLSNIFQDTLETCSKENEFKAVLFALCYFHAVVAERRKFGAQGWNRSYPFRNGDLTISVNILHNYLENNTKVPWDDLRYLFGEIMYGGHITDDRDRRLCKTYLEEFVRTEMLDGESLLAPGFPVPPNSDSKGYHDYASENLPPESPQLYGLHSNAEIGFLTVTSSKLFRTLLELQSRQAEGGGSGDISRQEKVNATLDEVLQKLPEPFNLAE